MNCTIPFTKEVKFKNSIAEILSISLEHDYTVNDNELLGNFIITGEYKSHEVSVNREAFDFVLPFSVNLTNPIDPDTLDFEIEDFTYDLLDNSTLKVNIEYSLKAEEIKKEEREEDKSEDEILDAECDTIINEAIEDNTQTESETLEDETREEQKTEEIPENLTNEENVIMNAIDEKENDFVTYHIHIMQENETIEAICSKYNVSSNVVEEYNDLKNITYGDKIIIPEIDE